MSSAPRIAIVGAGIAGLALRIALGRAGHRVLLLERRTTVAAGAGLLLVANGMRALDGLGIGDQVVARGNLVHELHWVLASGESLATFRLSDVFAPEDHFVTIRREALLEILCGADAGTDSEIRWGAELASIDETDDGVAIGLASGEKLCFDYAIGADGVRSRVRASAFAGAKTIVSSYVGWRALIECPPSLTHPTYVLGDARLITLCPVGDGKLYVYFGLEQEADAAPQTDPSGGSLERFRSFYRDFRGHAAPALAQIEEIDQLAFGFDAVVRAPSWASRRLLLVGDAAHAALPSSAQGASLALEDAQVLAELAGTAGLSPDIFDRFVARRSPRVAAVQDQSIEGARSNGIRGISDTLRRRAFAQLTASDLAARWTDLIAEPP